MATHLPIALVLPLVGCALALPGNPAALAPTVVVIVGSVVACVFCAVVELRRPTLTRQGGCEQSYLPSGSGDSPGA